MAANLTTQVEKFSATVPELLNLWGDQWAELGEQADRLPLDPNMDAYAALEENGLLLLVALRDGDVLAGYVLGIVTPSLHSRSTMTCYTDSFYVRPAFRGRLGGLRLLRHTRRELKARGVRLWFAASREGTDTHRLYTALGFHISEAAYALNLETA